MHEILVESLGSNLAITLELIIIILYGLCIGSFLNVVIYRIPINESLLKSASHCTLCNTKIKWYDNIPLISYILLRGKCRSCKAQISIQYPLIEALNAILWVIVYLKYQFTIETLTFCILTSALLSLSIIDEKTYEIPIQFNIFIIIVGIAYLIYDYNNALYHIIGAFCISSFLFILWIVTKGKGIGFGDIKLMFTCGLLVGWKIILMGFLIGCIISLPIHIVRMKITKKDHMLAFGPYLSAGIYISLFIGVDLVNTYIKFLGV